MKRLPFDASLPPTTGRSARPGIASLSVAPSCRPALRELRLEDERGGALDRERDRDADDDLVEAEANAEQHHEQGDAGAGEHARTEAEPHIVAVVGRDEARVGADQHHPLEADVENAGALRHELAEPREEERDADEKRAREEGGQASVRERPAREQQAHSGAFLRRAVTPGK